MCRYRAPSAARTASRVSSGGVWKTPKPSAGISTPLLRGDGLHVPPLNYPNEVQRAFQSSCARQLGTPGPVSTYPTDHVTSAVLLPVNVPATSMRRSDGPHRAWNLCLWILIDFRLYLAQPASRRKRLTFFPSTRNVIGLSIVACHLPSRG